MVSPGQTVRGTLPEGALAPLIGRLHRARASGWLRLTGMEVRGGIPSVIRAGFLLLDARVSAVEATDDPLRPLPPGADAGERATAAIARVLACRDVVQVWEPAAEAGLADPASPLLAAMALRALERLAGSAMRAALGDTGRCLSTCPPGEAALSALTSAQRILMTRVRSSATAAEIVAAGDEEDVARGLLALLCAGAAEWVAEPVPATPAGPSSAPPPASSGERPRTGASQAFRALSPEPVVPPPPRPPVAPAPDPAVVRRDVEQAHAALRGASHFSVLGIGPAASADEVRRAFTVLARRYHPDAQRDPALEDIRPKLTELFVAVSDAYAVLKDPVARDRYERALAARVAAESASAARRAAKPRAGPGADDSVEGRILRAEEALAAGEPWETVRILEETVPAAVGTTKARAQVLLARGYVERERPRDAEKVLLDALQGDPRALEACLLLARLYRDRGMVKRAQGMYEKALEIDPRQPEARRELAGLGTDPPDPGRGGGSLLSRLRDRR